MIVISISAPTNRMLTTPNHIFSGFAPGREGLSASMTREEFYKFVNIINSDPAPLIHLLYRFILHGRITDATTIQTLYSKFAARYKEEITKGSTSSVDLLADLINERPAEVQQSISQMVQSTIGALKKHATPTIRDTAYLVRALHADSADWTTEMATFVRFIDEQYDSAIAESSVCSNCPFGYWAFTYPADQDPQGKIPGILQYFATQSTNPAIKSRITELRSRHQSEFSKHGYHARAPVAPSSGSHALSRPAIPNAAQENEPAFREARPEAESQTTPSTSRQKKRVLAVVIAVIATIAIFSVSRYLYLHSKQPSTNPPKPSQINHIKQRKALTAR